MNLKLLSCNIYKTCFTVKYIYIYIYVCVKKTDKDLLGRNLLVLPLAKSVRSHLCTNLSQNKTKKEKTQKFSGLIIISILLFFMAQLYGWLSELERFLKNDA